MANSNSVLSNYYALVQNHANQFDPEITALQQLVQQRMQDLKQQEQTLVEAQMIELQRITDALATDARYFLPTPEFTAFVQKFKKPSHGYSYNQKSELINVDDPTTWLLATLNVPVSISDYQTHEDPDGYDDERIHILYSYSLLLKLCNAECRIEVPYKRIYNVNEQDEPCLEDQIDCYILGEIEDLLGEIEHPESERTQLGEELSILVGYAATLFALKPRTATFVYSSTQKN
ncbi:hypothetical protein F7734_40545 [Scytonema sp. UIC 10036]|uniref:hypothetical protein n=1 Tax=Scytonema sp. UIC 10036 TaxID=2304196 RepID=UPI0012DAC592|nr:hypothetical protein [Scytonema sp. UIC 10036]MUG98265.1 hypothetical protein [Scytonema sp. UIC 10036]